MADFAVTVERIRAIEPIEGADKIELAVIGEFRSVVAKGAFKAGNLAVYIPEASILPEWLIERLGLVGKLSGGQKNRVKAIRLRGCLSQGIVYPIDREWTRDPHTESIPYTIDTVIGEEGKRFSVLDEGDDVTEFFGIKKYDPTEAMDANMRRKMNGECAYIPGKTVKYDLENWKKHSNVFVEGEMVVITEKLHGTMCCFAFNESVHHPDLPGGKFVYSKGLGASGQVFKWNEANAENLYIKAFHSLTERIENNRSFIIGFDDAALLTQKETTYEDYDVIARMADFLYHEGIHSGPFYLFGEVYGKGVQDLGYGEEGPKFRAFDLYLGEPGQGFFVNAFEKFVYFDSAGIPSVPVLYTGPYSREKVLEYTDGTTTIGGGHIREGIVITPRFETTVNRLGRKILKNVSGDYLTRKGNTTEFQ